jgi:2-keto-4-pentenoate hydratase/2-oxohepta-3-ene-1,7-dioic acid hydratase in catechol pathway
MKISRFLSAAGPRLGIVQDELLWDLVAAAEERGQSWLIPVFSDIRLFLSGGEGSRAAAKSIIERARFSQQALSTSRLLAPYEFGSKILAMVVNYHGHDRDAKVKIPAKPFFFQKPGSCVANPEDPIVKHQMSSKLDHEVEVGVIIGKTGRDIPVESAYGYVGGYTVVNDVSYRDLQMNEGLDDLNKSYGKNWTQGKGLDLSFPMGPLLVLANEMEEPYPLNMTCKVNGVVRQKANTEEMIYKVPALIAEISRGMTLHPGDVIATGSCAGGGLRDGKFLEPGDLVECEIEGIGVLRNKVTAYTDHR